MRLLILKIIGYVCGLVLFFLLGVEIVEKNFGELDPERFLPEDTVFFGEMDVNNAYQKDVLEEYLADFSVDEKEFFAMALVRNPETMGLERVLISDVKHQMGDYYMFQEAGMFFYTENTLFGEWLIDYRGRSLRESKAFKKVKKKLPKGFAFVFVNFENMDDGFFQEFPVLSELGLNTEVKNSLVSNFAAEGATIFTDGNEAYLQSFLLLKEEVDLDGGSRWSKDLERLVGVEAEVFFAGGSLESLVSGYVELLVGNSERGESLYDLILQKSSERWFGGEVNFVEDILEVFDGDFAFSMESGAYKVMFELKDHEEEFVSLVESLAVNIGSFEQKVVVSELPDGTQTREVVAVPSRLEVTEVNYRGEVVKVLRLVDGRVISYALIEGLGIVGSSEEVVKKTIDLYKGDGESLADSAVYQSVAERIGNYSREMMFMRGGEVFLSGEFSANFFGSFEGVFSGRKVLSDGVITLNYLK